MKVLSIIMLLSAIAILWMVAHVMYKPAYDKLKKEYVSDEDSIKLAIVCVFFMLFFAFTIGLLL
jgi:hypothetical protein